IVTQTFTVVVNGDTAIELNETFAVNLSNATNAVIGDTQGVATIVDNDTPLLSLGSLSVNSVNEGNAGTTNANFSVTLSPVNPTQTVTVNYATSDGSFNPATAGVDYVAAAGTLTFLPGISSQSFRGVINGDRTIEP